MPKSLNITEARKQFLSLPDQLGLGEEVKVYRHHEPVLKIIRMQGEPPADPFVILDEAIKDLTAPRHPVPRSLAKHYKSYLYGQKG